MPRRWLAFDHSHHRVVNRWRARQSSEETHSKDEACMERSAAEDARLLLPPPSSSGMTYRATKSASCCFVAERDLMQARSKPASALEWRPFVVNAILSAHTAVVLRQAAVHCAHQDTSPLLGWCERVGDWARLLFTSDDVRERGALPPPPTAAAQQQRALDKKKLLFNRQAGGRPAAPAARAVDQVAVVFARQRRARRR